MISERQVLGSERLELMSPALPPMGTQGIDRWHYCDHHQAHALAAYYSSPFRSALVVSYDSTGAFFGNFREMGLRL